MWNRTDDSSKIWICSTESPGFGPGEWHGWDSALNMSIVEPFFEQGSEDEQGGTAPRAAEGQSAVKLSPVEWNTWSPLSDPWMQINDSYYS